MALKTLEFGLITLMELCQIVSHYEGFGKFNPTRPFTLLLMVLDVAKFITLSKNFLTRVTEENLNISISTKMLEAT